MIDSFRLLTFILLVIATLPITGCSFSKIVINEKHQHIDTDRIIVGKTTYMQILEEQGPPAPLTIKQDGSSLISKHHLRYATVDSRTTGFLWGAWLILPFNWNSTLNKEDTLIEFDENGVVTHVAQISRNNYWRPFQGPDPNSYSIVIKD